MNQSTQQAKIQEKQEIVMKHYAMAQAIARRIHSRLPRSVELDDLVSAGVLGLMDAIDRYDATRAVPFATYAKHRIHGAVVDTLRANDWVPRSVRRRANSIRSTQEVLTHKYGRRPTAPEMAEALEVNPQRYQKMLQGSEIRTVLSLDAPGYQDEDSSPLIERVPSNVDVFEESNKRQLHKLIIDNLQTLPEREKTAVALYYFHELSLKEVGKVLGVTESRACQLSSQGIKRLRKRLSALIPNS